AQNSRNNFPKPSILSLTPQRRSASHTIAWCAVITLTPNSCSSGSIANAVGQCGEGSSSSSPHGAKRNAGQRGNAARPGLRFAPSGLLARCSIELQPNGLDDWCPFRNLLTEEVARLFRIRIEVGLKARGDE